MMVWWWLVMAVLVAGLWVPSGVAAQGEDEALAGEFAVTIAVEDVPPELTNGASLVGRWQIGFGADGTYTRGRQDVGELATGRFEIDGDRLSLIGEAGLLACPASGADVGAVYEWELTAGQLRLVAIEEPCATRRLLLTTRILDTFVACPSPAASTQRSTPEAGAVGPGVATPIGSDAQADAGQTAADPGPAIETLVKQLSSCWATRDPDRFLPLLSEAFAASQTDDGDDDRRRLALAMASPIVWDQVSDLERHGAERVSATVRQLAGDYVDFVRYDFVYEGGAWRWDGVADAAVATPSG
jgi:hypothetical protein